VARHRRYGGAPAVVAGASPVVPGLPMSAVEPLTVVVIGAGDMGARHARHWAAAGARVVAVVDPDRTRAELAAAETGAEAFTDAEGASPRARRGQRLHPDLPARPYTIAALEAGAHVLCEKPVALTLADAYAMRDAAAAAGRELRIGFMRRFDPAFDQLIDVTGAPAARCWRRRRSPPACARSGSCTTRWPTAGRSSTCAATCSTCGACCSAGSRAR
jgi:threonine dehydrogenase-like Zn-dependent dehydrogenase